MCPVPPVSRSETGLSTLESDKRCLNRSAEPLPPKKALAHFAPRDGLVEARLELVLEVGVAQQVVLAFKKTQAPLLLLPAADLGLVPARRPRRSSDHANQKNPE